MTVTVATVHIDTDDSDIDTSDSQLPLSTLTLLTVAVTAATVHTDTGQLAGCTGLWQPDTVDIDWLLQVKELDPSRCVPQEPPGLQQEEKLEEKRP